MRTAFILHLYPEPVFSNEDAVYVQYTWNIMPHRLGRSWNAQDDFKKSPTVHFNVDSQTGSDAASYIMMFIPLHAKQLHHYITLHKNVFQLRLMLVALLGIYKYCL